MLSKGQLVYYARIMPNIGIYEIIELKIRTVKDTYFVGTENKTQHAYLFGYSCLEKYVFVNRKDALKLVKEAEKNNKQIVVSKDTYYEEY